MTGTTVATRTPEPRWGEPSPATGAVPTSYRRVVLGVVPWLLVAASLVGALLWLDTPGSAVLRYGTYWILAVVVPGVLVYRALRGSRGNLPEDLGFGATTGIAVNLVGWALAVGTGLGGLLWVWPVLVIAVFAAVPGLRRHLRIADPQPLPLTWSWLIAALMLLAVLMLALIEWATNPLPPATHTLFGDIYYHWANAAELRRTINPQQPQMAGEPLRYHWFSDAYRASASMISGVPLGTVMLRLWGGPVVLTSIVVIAGLARQASRVWWSGPVAAFIAVALPVTSIWPRFASYPVTIMPWYSPTLIFSIPFVTAVAALLVDIARGVRLGRGWVLFGLLLLVATASKSSSLPVLFGGITLASAAAWVLHRRPPWTMFAALGAALLVLGITMPTLAGGASGAGIQIGAAFSFKAEFWWLSGRDFVAGTGGLLPTPMRTMPWGLRLILPVLICCFVLSQIGRVLGFAALLRKQLRTDVAAWLLAGIGLAGWAGTLLINHTANGELYFAYSAIPAEAALTAWLLTALAPARRTALVVVGGLVLGAVTGALIWRFGPGGQVGYWQVLWRYSLARPVLTLAAVLGCGVLLWYLLRIRFRAMVGAGLAVLAAATVGLGWDTTYRDMSGRVEGVRAGRLPTTGSQASFWVEKTEMQAAEWLARNAPPKDVVATNVHCEKVRTTSNCINRSFWVSGLTEHAVVLEGWAYQPAVQARHGENGKQYYELPAPDPQRLQVNDTAFTAPTAAGLAELRDRYRARWLYADDRAGPVSPLLASLATARFHAGPVTVYELTGPAPD
ncbi:hypothetical protein ACWKSP_14545 [Micromonosporaceae bacterium Da 78-11]